MEDLKKKVQEGAASVTAPVREAASDAGDKVGETVFSASRSVVGEWRKLDDGTPLRDGIRFVRERLNDALAAAHGCFTSASCEADGLVSLVRTNLSPLDPFKAQAEELRKSSPQVLVTGAATAAMVLSVFGGKGAMVKNGVLAAAFSSMAISGMQFWETRGRK